MFHGIYSLTDCPGRCPRSDSPEVSSLAEVLGAPGLELAQDNLDDLCQPVGKRHTPWAFDIGNWVTQKAISDLVTDLEPVARRGREEALTQAARLYLR